MLRLVQSNGPDGAAMGPPPPSTAADPTRPVPRRSVRHSAPLLPLRDTYCTRCSTCGAESGAGHHRGHIARPRPLGRHASAVPQAGACSVPPSIHHAPPGRRLPSVRRLRCCTTFFAPAARWTTSGAFRPAATASPHTRTRLTPLLPLRVASVVHGTPASPRELLSFHAADYLKALQRPGCARACGQEGRDSHALPMPPPSLQRADGAAAGALRAGRRLRPLPRPVAVLPVRRRRHAAGSLRAGGGQGAHSHRVDGCGSRELLLSAPPALSTSRSPLLPRQGAATTRARAAPRAIAT